MPRRLSAVSRLALCLSVCGLSLAAAQPAMAAAKAPAPTAQEKAELDKYPAFSDPVHVLESNPEGAIHKFLEKNDGKTVWLDTTILRYAPIDMSQIGDPILLATTDRFQNPVYTKCWPDPKKDIEGLGNFGAEGFPLPLDQADIAAGCATRIRFVWLNGQISSAGLNPVFGDNKVQLIFAGFFTVAKSDAGGKTLYTLTQQEVPFETVLAFETHKRVKTRPIENLGMPEPKPLKEGAEDGGGG